MREVQVTLPELGLLVGTRGRGLADHAAERGYVFVAWR
jgi:hypothetical protein